MFNEFLRYCREVCIKSNNDQKWEYMDNMHVHTCRCSCVFSCLHADNMQMNENVCLLTSTYAFMYIISFYNFLIIMA